MSLASETFLPPAKPLEPRLLKLVSRPGPARLVDPKGTSLELPVEVFEVLRDVVEAMSAGRAVVVAPIHQRLSTQEAAEFLGISRPTLIKLLEQGEIPFERPGRHRRVLLTEVLAYKARRSEQTKAALGRVAEISDELGLYDKTSGRRLRR